MEPRRKRNTLSESLGESEPMVALHERKSVESDILKRAAIFINPKIKAYRFDEVRKILDSGEFPINYPITDTQMSSLGLLCAMPDISTQI